MIGRIVEIEQDGRYLSVFRGFMVVYERGGGSEIGRVPLEDIATVLINSHGVTYSNNLIIELSRRNILLVACGSNHLPSAVLIPVEGNYEQSKRIDSQIAATLPMKKRAWAQIVRSKLEGQAFVLETRLQNGSRLRTLAKSVTSGDPKNLEAVGAAVYFPSLFGKDFRRRVELPGVNSLLNYGYTIMRSCVARSVISSGLHPSFGVKHSNAGNALRLVDDLVEPFRPFVDLQVIELCQDLDLNNIEITSVAKKSLVNCLYRQIPGSDSQSPISNQINSLVSSFSQFLLRERSDLQLPILPKFRMNSE